MLPVVSWLNAERAAPRTITATKGNSLRLLIALIIWVLLKKVGKLKFGLEYLED